MYAFACFTWMIVSNTWYLNDVLKRSKKFHVIFQNIILYILNFSAGKGTGDWKSVGVY